MGIFFERKETEDKIIITYKYRMIFYITVIVSSFLAMMLAGIERFVFSAITALILIVYMADSLPLGSEIRAAMKEGGVKMTGSTWSFSNPIRAEITKIGKKESKE